MKKSFRIGILLSCCAVLGAVLLVEFGDEWLVVEKPLAKADAILILGGSATFRERTSRAAELYQQGLAPRIILTNDGQKGGWSDELQRNPYFVERAQWNLEEKGVPKEKIFIAPQVVESTYDEAVTIRNYSQENSLDSLAVVTSDFHTRRALYIFEKIFGADSAKQIGIYAAEKNQSSNSRSWLQNKQRRGFVTAEYIKMIYYWLIY